MGVSSLGMTQAPWWPTVSPGSPSLFGFSVRPVSRSPGGRRSSGYVCFLTTSDRGRGCEQQKHRGYLRNTRPYQKAKASGSSELPGTGKSRHSVAQALQQEQISLLQGHDQ